jgi:c-di-GMP-binding flagellar brake protein YcgR
LGESILKINTRIEIAKVGSLEYYTSSIQDIKDDVLYIGMPTLCSDPLVLTPGQKVTVRFPGISERYQFSSTFLSFVKDPIVLYRLTMPNEIKRIQQRNYFRVDTLLEVFVSEIPEIGEEENYIKANALDISGGGMKLLIKLLPDQTYHVGKELLVKFNITANNDELVEIKTRVRIVREDQLATQTRPGQRLGCYGVSFVGLSEKFREKIISFIFRIMAVRNK